MASGIFQSAANCSNLLHDEAVQKLRQTAAKEGWPDAKLNGELAIMETTRRLLGKITQPAFPGPEDLIAHFSNPTTLPTTRLLVTTMFEEGPALNGCFNHVCKIENPTLKKCSRCSVALYCSTDCQKAHWKAHKRVCQIKSPPATNI